RHYSWLVTATTPSGRFAYLGFSGLWTTRWRPGSYRRSKAYGITDRPVYRPGQEVKFKFWVEQALYDAEGDSPFAGRSFALRLRGPRGKKIWEKVFQADRYGGFDGKISLPADATLGVYYLQLLSRPYGGVSFRVEEYKKPEFEVKVEAPAEPVMLGEKFQAKVSARYYFGAPVTKARVKYKVLRTAYSGSWYPVTRWDWLYGRGYWWFSYDYTWYPGWETWGCRRPVPWWWSRPSGRPEVVAQGEAPIAKDGTLSIPIDTALAKVIHGDSDHRYSITAEVTDQSRRTIVGTGAVLVARRPFKVFAWLDRGHYRVGDTVRAEFAARRLDGKGVKGKGEARLFKVTYVKGKKPLETLVRKWELATGDDGRASLVFQASRAGQYRLSFTLTDAKGHAEEGGYVFVVTGPGFDGRDFRFNQIELVADKKTYRPGEEVNLLVNTERLGSTVLLFLRPVGGVYLSPKVLRLQGKSVLEKIAVTKADMPNFFVEALTVSGGKVYTEVRQIAVPPESRVLNVAVLPSRKEYKPGAPAKVKIRVTDASGEPVRGSVALTMYDKAVEYISGGSNVPDIQAFFWKWKRRHSPRTWHSLARWGGDLPEKTGMAFLGVFGWSVANEELAMDSAKGQGGDWGARKKAEGMLGAPMRRAMKSKMRGGGPPPPGAPPTGAPLPESADREFAGGRGAASETGGKPAAAPKVRKKFADTALWVGFLETGKDGTAEVSLTMPENLTAWKTRVWVMGSGARCGEGSVEVVTTKKLLLRLQAPRFFVQKDRVMLTANIHNYLKSAKKVTAVLELAGGTLVPAEGEKLEKTLQVASMGEERVNWMVRVAGPGKAVVRMKALTDEESDAMEMTFPVLVHGMLKTVSYSGAIRPDKKGAVIEMTVPAERLPEKSRLEVRWSPTLAGAMVDALPYLASYPYGCTEQTLNRFLPTVITQKILLEMGLDLSEIRKKRTNLNAQEIGNDKKRAAQWKRWKGNPVFDEKTVKDMVKAGLERLASMQCSDGGWGWFSGWGEYSWPHTTALVVHGLQVARENDVAVPPSMLSRGIAWLEAYQARQLQRIRNGRKDPKVRPWKSHADNLDALVFTVLAHEKKVNSEMLSFLYEDRNKLSVYAKAMLGYACNEIGDKARRDMLLRNVEQYLKEDGENQTAWLELPNGGYWWRWYGSEFEAEAWYLK
ncbi:MAG TPA: alpha-2-macroglobulin, partial [Planctomycetes bacterium]|nr:alpha-2-macroglobulin [Planctomycetota bacterium]